MPPALIVPLQNFDIHDTPDQIPPYILELPIYWSIKQCFLFS